MTRNKFRSMHKASRVHETSPSATPKGGKTGDHPYPRVNPPPQRKTAAASPKAREIAVTRRSGPAHAEVPPMKERPAVGGRKPLHNHLERFEEEREDFSCRRVERTGNQQRAPGCQNSNSAPLWTSNERLDRVVGTPHRDRRPANRARKRQGGADARRSLRSSTKAADSPSTAGGHS